VLAGLSGLSLHEAVNRPRVHVHRAGRPDEIVRRETDLTILRRVGATLVDADGHLVAAADPRREGAVRLVEARQRRNSRNSTAIHVISQRKCRETAS
jgi:gamma-glutamyltranspeptidase/glutathione hydrolase